MNTQHKPVQYLACKVCDSTYMKIGEVPVLLAQHRPPGLDPQTGQMLEGTCPRHPRHSSGGEEK